MNQSTVLHPDWLAALSAMFSESVTIQAATETAGDYGAITPTWTNVTGLTSIPAAVVPVTTAGERKGEPRTITVGQYQVGLKGYYVNITTKHRAVLWSRNFDIIAVHHAPFQAYTQLVIQEVA